MKGTQSSDDDERENSPTLAVQQKSIMDNLLLAEEHLVFKFSSIDSGVKCSEIVASVNAAKGTSSIITAIMISLRDWFFEDLSVPPVDNGTICCTRIGF